MRVLRVHCHLRDLQAAARWFEQVWRTPWFTTSGWLGWASANLA